MFGIVKRNPFSILIFLSIIIFHFLLADWIGFEQPKKSQMQIFKVKLFPFEIMMSAQAFDPPNPKCLFSFSFFSIGRKIQFKFWHSLNLFAQPNKI